MIGLALLALALLAWRLRGGSGLVPALRVAVKADVVAEGVRFFHQEGGRLRLRLMAGRVRYFDARRRVELEGINATLWGARGREVRITALRGSYSIPAGRLRLQGRVLLTTPQGDRLSTSALLLDQKRMVMESTTPVLFQRSGLVLRGKGFRYDLRRGRLEVEQQKSTIKGGEFPG